MSGSAGSARWGRLALPLLVTVLGFVAHGVAVALPGWLAEPMGEVAPSAGRVVTGLIAWLGLAWTFSRALAIVLRSYPRLLADLVGAALFGVAGIAIMLFVFQVPATGLIATSSVLIAVLGFALRNIIGDVFSGIVLGIERPYRIGDWVEVTEGALGRVVELNWRATRLVNPDGVSFSLPNGLVALHRLVNYSAERGGRYRTGIRVPMDPTLSPERVERILLAAALEAEEEWPGLAPDVILAEFTPGAAVYLVRFHPADYGRDGPCRDAVARAVLRGLQKVGLTIQRPLQNVMINRAPTRAPRRRREHLLEHVDLFRPFTADERLALADAMVESLFARGDVIMREGEAGQSLYLLAEGTLEVSKTDAAGRKVLLDRILPGAVFGEMSLLTGQPRSATIIAGTDGALYEIHREHLDPMLRERPQLAEGLGAVMAERQARNFAKSQAADINAAPPPSSEDLLGRLKSFFRL